MLNGPRNAASDLQCLRAPLLSLLRRIRDDDLAILDADHLVEDHRRLSVHRRYPGRAVADAIVELEELGGGGSTWRIAEVIAVRGDRIALARIVGQVTDGSQFELVELRSYDRDMRTQRVAFFDADAVDNATELLDEWYAEDSEPADRDAIERARERLLLLRDRLTN